MSSISQFEIHPGSRLGEEPADAAPLPWHEQQPPKSPPPVAIQEADGLIYVGIDPATGKLERVADAENAIAALQVVRRRLSSDLAMIALKEGLRVNGLPATPFSVLAVKDSLVLSAGSLSYVTERFRPFIGAPADGLIGKKCPYCRIPVQGTSRVVTCRCGAPYHWETAESHPDVPDADRLKCFEKVKTCLSCNRELTTEERLVWEPTSL